METSLDETFLQVEQLFTDEIYRQTPAQTGLNFCCDEENQTNMIEMARVIKQVQPYSELSYRDIFIALIFTYYSLLFNEQTEDWLRTTFITPFLI
jgi:hypothetical protein